MENLTQGWTQWGPCLLNQENFFDFQKRAGKAFAISPVFAHLSVWLNLHQYPWISLNILENAWTNCSDYVHRNYFSRVLNMTDHLACSTLLKMPCVLNVSGFWIWHGCICKGYAEFWILLNIAQYASIMPGYVAVCFNVPQCAWINSSKYVRVLNMRHHLHWLTSKGFERKPFRAFLIIKDQEFF